MGTGIIRRATRICLSFASVGVISCLFGDSYIYFNKFFISPQL